MKQTVCSSFKFVIRLIIRFIFILVIYQWHWQLRLLTESLFLLEVLAPKVNKYN